MPISISQERLNNGSRRADRTIASGLAAAARPALLPLRQRRESTGDCPIAAAAGSQQPTGKVNRLPQAAPG